MEQGLLSLTKFSGGFNSLLQSQPFSVPDQLFSPNLSYLTNGGVSDLFNVHSPLCSPKHNAGGGVGGRDSASLSQTPSTISVDDDEHLPVDDPTATERRQILARLMLQYQEVNDRYDLCFSHYRNAVEEAEALRQENAQLRLTNAELTHLLALLTSKQSHVRLPERTFSAPSRTFSAVSSIADEFRRFGIGEESSPTSVLGGLKDGGGQFSRGGSGGSGGVGGSEKKVPLPKSISIRPSGFLKLNHSSSSTSAGANRNGRVRVASPVMMGSQGVVVGSSTKEAGEEQAKDIDGCNGEQSQLELEVYTQGTFKTELCNKWEELGECPYGEHCQFAHGIAELRPVIRHPRYKTEVCRMVLAGDTCPYGHRCHFRHALCAQDLLLLQNPTTSVNNPHL